MRFGKYFEEPKRHTIRFHIFTFCRKTVYTYINALMASHFHKILFVYFLAQPYSGVLKDIDVIS